MASHASEKLAHEQLLSGQIQYEPVPYGFAAEETGHEFDAAVKADEGLKRRIRILRFVSRLMATILSIGVFVPMVMTVSKFLSTRDVFREVTDSDGVTINRNAWALDSKVWPTYMYFAIAGISLILNLVIMLAYLRDIRAANRAATIASVFTGIITLGNVIVWLVSVIIYRYEKDLNGLSNDLWGWTCSSAAEEIQKDFSDVIQFNTYCNVQSTSWYIGLIQTVTSILSGVILFLALRRRKTKAKATEVMKRTTHTF